MSKAAASEARSEAKPSGARAPAQAWPRSGRELLWSSAELLWSSAKASEVRAPA